MAEYYTMSSLPNYSLIDRAGRKKKNGVLKQQVKLLAGKTTLAGETKVA